MRYCILILILAVGGLAGGAGEGRSDWILDHYESGTPNGSWAYSKVAGLGQGNSNTFIPMRSYWAGAGFEGYVHSGSGGDWNTVGAFSEYLPDTIYLFRTFIESAKDTTISVYFTGDDGHTLYIDGRLVNSGPFGTDHSFDIPLQAGLPIEVEIGDYNGPGPMGIQFNIQGTHARIEDLPGITFNANGQFTIATPGPASFALLSIGGGAVLVYGRLRRKRATALRGSK